MRLFGHPIHTMLLHFPVALWPAHWLLHIFASRLPAGAGGAVGFWILLAATALGWIAAFFGTCDLLAIARENDRKRLATGLVHGAVNGGVLVGFSSLLVLEYPHFPSIAHGAGFLAAEGVLLGALGAGNYFGGCLVWGRPGTRTSPDQA